MLSNEKAWGIAGNDLLRLPKITGLILFRTLEAVQTPSNLPVCNYRLLFRQVYFVQLISTIDAIFVMRDAKSAGEFDEMGPGADFAKMRCNFLQHKNSNNPCIPYGGIVYYSCEEVMPMDQEDSGALLEESCHTGSERKSHHSDKTKSNLISRLNRIEGQIRGVKGMIEKDTYCDDVLNQLAAIQSALNSVGKLLLENHLNSCVIERIQEGDHEVVKELMITMNKLIK
jgi:DNA-binding FrmR family transcriptional regulator